MPLLISGAAPCNFDETVQDGLRGRKVTAGRDRAAAAKQEGGRQCDSVYRHESDYTGDLQREGGLFVTPTVCPSGESIEEEWLAMVSYLNRPPRRAPLDVSQQGPAAAALVPAVAAQRQVGVMRNGAAETLDISLKWRGESRENCRTK